MCVCLRVCFKENSASVLVECMYINVYFFKFWGRGVQYVFRRHVDPPVDFLFFCVGWNTPMLGMSRLGA